MSWTWPMDRAWARLLCYVIESQQHQHGRTSLVGGGRREGNTDKRGQTRASPEVPDSTRRDGMYCSKCHCRLSAIAAPAAPLCPLDMSPEHLAGLDQTPLLLRLGLSESHHKVLLARLLLVRRALAL